ncbi:MAG TPA: tryptophan dimethylallyltransferase family protein [Polyangiaceae bacterium]|nr:tryptophan dimethylallyltransferase family protein [Polyangiaceae bacterium]
MLKLVKAHEGPTYRELGQRKLEGLVRGLGIGADLGSATRLFELLTATWHDRPVTGTPLFSSDVTDDGTPFEFSVAFAAGRPLIRVLAEAQTAPFDAESGWTAGLELTRRLALTVPGVDLERFQRIQALYAPPSGSSSRFSLWHAGTVEADGTLSFKVYLNPRIAGASLAPEIVRETLVRLGADYAWSELEPKLRATSELLYVSLDLARSADARVKVYVAHPHATSGEIDELLRDECGYQPGLAARWIEELTGSAGTFDERPLLTCYAFRSPHDAAEVTVHVPTRCYVGNDAESVLRAGELVGPLATALRAGVEGMAGRPLEMGRGLVTYVSVRPVADGTRVTTYLAPEAHAISTPRHSTLPMSFFPTLAPSSETSLARSSEMSLSPPPAVESFVRTLGTGAQSGGQSFAVVEALIASSARSLRAHPLLVRLEGAGTVEEMQVLAPRFTFYVMCFQDMLRLGSALTTDPVLKELAVTHEAEDLGHEQWFLYDLEALGVERNLAWTFSPEHAVTRDISYRIMSEIVGATHDATRLAVLLALEAIGAEFFGRVIGYLDRLGRAEGLRYFARSHQLVEQSHEVFEAPAQGRLSAVLVPSTVMPEIVRAVTRTFEAMTRLGDDIDARMQDCASRAGLRAVG